MHIVLLLLGLTACSAGHITSAIGWVMMGLMGVWLLLPRSGRADAGVDASADMAGSDAGVDMALEPSAEVCLCAASPGAHAPLSLHHLPLPGLEPLRIRDRVLASLPPDVRARLKD
jgi:hypothetical protein